MSRLLRLALPFCLAFAAASAVADDGDPDTSFSSDGKATFAWPDGQVQAETTAVATFADGSIAVAGWIDNGNNNRDFSVVRFTRNGDVDTMFGNLGSVVVPFDIMPGADDRAVAAFAQADGSLLVVGHAGIAVQPYQYPALIRLLPNGQLDPSFGTGGKYVVTSHPLGTGASLLFTKALRQPDGKIVLAGICGSCGNGGPPDFLALRLLANGLPDAGFGNQGWFNAGRVDGTAWVDETLTSIALDPAGRLLLGGYQEVPSDPNERRTPLVVCVGTNGQRDPTFGDDGYSAMNLLGSWEVGAITAAQRTIAGGFIQRRIFVAVNLDADNSQTPASFLMAMNPDGDVLDTFGTNGLTDLTREEGTKIRALVMRPDDTVTAAGWIDRAGAAQYDFFVGRTLFDGTLDTTFDNDGVRVVAFDLTTNGEDLPTAMTLSALRPVVAGIARKQFGSQIWNTAVLRMNSDLIFESGF
ncbi:MAG TPA: hypothetical protein VLF18_21990 [Tahibacter sp.]|uniref:hypothetical protein n=1 Tax=Tahibacter sp. TaxID=2056211 RepID=UPI002B696F13|nr:hypothetical protein [Tahibacter sp.]HSX62864.1 hypothetical protein [Tahibacter sp.]